MKKEKEFRKELVDEILYFHGKTTDGTRFTIAGKFDGNHLNVGASVCCKNDIFVKSAGRSIARTRLLSSRNPREYGRTFYISIDITENKYDYFIKVGFMCNQNNRVRLLKNFHLYNSPELPF